MNQEEVYYQKVDILTHYGGGKCACVKCGFDDIRALTIDHINGGGNRHRNSLCMPFYQWLVDNDFPLGYRTLCMNCQFIVKAQLSRHRYIKRPQPIIFALKELAQSSELDWVKPATV